MYKPLNSWILIHCYSLTETWDLSNPDEKYDVIPEIWEGHNVADFVDPDIMEVCKSCLKQYEVFETPYNMAMLVHEWKPLGKVMLYRVGPVITIYQQSIKFFQVLNTWFHM